MQFAKTDESRDPLTEKIIGAAIEVHRTLGPGLLESVYEKCLCYELSQMGIQFTRQQEWPVKYKEILIDCGFRTDVIVEQRVVVEIKACQAVLPIHEATVMTYMKLSGINKALILNFNVFLLKDGIQRFVL